MFETTDGDSVFYRSLAAVGVRNFTTPALPFHLLAPYVHGRGRAHVSGIEFTEFFDDFSDHWRRTRYGRSGRFVRPQSTISGLKFLFDNDIPYDWNLVDDTGAVPAVHFADMDQWFHCCSKFYLSFDIDKEMNVLNRSIFECTSDDFAEVLKVWMAANLPILPHSIYNAAAMHARKLDLLKPAMAFYKNKVSRQRKLGLEDLEYAALLIDIVAFSDALDCVPAADDDPSRDNFVHRALLVAENLPELAPKVLKALDVLVRDSDLDTLPLYCGDGTSALHLLLGSRLISSLDPTNYGTTTTLAHVVSCLCQFIPPDMRDARTNLTPLETLISSRYASANNVMHIEVLTDIMMVGLEKYIDNEKEHSDVVLRTANAAPVLPEAAEAATECPSAASVTMLPSDVIAKILSMIFVGTSSFFDKYFTLCLAGKVVQAKMRESEQHGWEIGVNLESDGASLRRLRHFDESLPQVHHLELTLSSPAFCNGSWSSLVSSVFPRLKTLSLKVVEMHVNYSSAMLPSQQKGRNWTVTKFEADVTHIFSSAVAFVQSTTSLVSAGFLCTRHQLPLLMDALSGSSIRDTLVSLSISESSIRDELCWDAASDSESWAREILSGERIGRFPILGQLHIDSKHLGSIVESDHSILGALNSALLHPTLELRNIRSINLDMNLFDVLFFKSFDKKRQSLLQVRGLLDQMAAPLASHLILAWCFKKHRGSTTVDLERLIDTGFELGLDPFAKVEVGDSHTRVNLWSAALLSGEKSWINHIFGKSCTEGDPKYLGTLRRRGMDSKSLIDSDQLVQMAYEHPEALHGIKEVLRFYRDEYSCEKHLGFDDGIYSRLLVRLVKALNGVEVVPCEPEDVSLDQFLHRSLLVAERFDDVDLALEAMRLYLQRTKQTNAMACGLEGTPSLHRILKSSILTKLSLEKEHQFESFLTILRRFHENVSSNEPDPATGLNPLQTLVMGPYTSQIQVGVWEAITAILSARDAPAKLELPDPEIFLPKGSKAKLRPTSTLSVPSKPKKSTPNAQQPSGQQDDNEEEELELARALSLSLMEQEESLALAIQNSLPREEALPFIPLELPEKPPTRSPTREQLISDLQFWMPDPEDEENDISEGEQQEEEEGNDSDC
eukprot:TRINITY_DN6360_c0_g1_i1.p1 TRINITY_DN6360_c0_g1~~TRINITY_DN6360_c0_g1_i1.p1  ORF type:complete len:1123 (-),score=160.17 TRINITY_DN6360_c0_g1_i1:2142-5510(-)